MLTIYNRQKVKVGAFQTTGNRAEVADVTITKRLNSIYTLSFLLPMGSAKYGLIEDEGLIECEGQKYIIKGNKETAKAWTEK